MSQPGPSDPYPSHGSVVSRSFLPLALITLGVAFLLGNVVPAHSRGGLVVLGLGAAFLVGRVTTARYGYAVPAGILIGIGAFLSLEDVQGTRSVQGGGWFFVLLGLGFVLVYLIGLRPWAVWPLFPAAVLLGLGGVLFGISWLGALASLSWMMAYWPIVLVVVGLWLLVRDRLPLAARRPIATLGGLALLAYGILAAAASIASGGAVARAGLAAGFGTSPFADSLPLDAPIQAGQTFSVNNPNGRTTVHGGSNANVHVVVSRHFNMGGRAPDVHLTPDSNGVSLSSSTSGGPFPFGGSGSVDYAIDVPSGVQVNVTAASGQVDVDGVTGAVQAETSSGALNLTNLPGSVQARSSSGSLTLNNVAGDLRASTSSGQVRGTQLLHVREITTSSGSISIEGTFTDPAQLRASSGSITVKLLAGSAVQLDVKSGSGSVEPQNIFVTGGATSRNALTGNLGTPAPGAILSIQTTSGSIHISQ